MTIPADPIMCGFRAEYQRYRALGEAALAQTDDAQFLHAFGEISIATYVKHIGGNLHSRFDHFLTEDGEKPWRNRDGEFEQDSRDRGACLAIWNQGWKTLEDTLTILTDGNLALAVTIRGIPLLVSEALSRSMAHTSYHVGQIVVLARMQKGAEWKSLSIPKGGSQAYNQNPTSEKLPTLAEGSGKKARRP